MSAGAMAKKRAPKAASQRDELVAIRCTAAFKAWLDALVEHAEVGTRSQAIKNALKLYGKHVGFDEAPPKP